MVVRRHRKARKQRGKRTHGRGFACRGRGSGEKGGKGLSGGHKHKWSYVLKYMPEHFGKRGFTRPPAVGGRVGTIKVGELDERLEELLQRDIARREGEKIVIDVKRLGVGKVLGGGRIAQPLEVIAKEFAGSAKRKLEEAGGKAIEG